MNRMAWTQWTTIISWRMSVWAWALALAGCQAATGVHDRPLLPLLSRVEPIQAPSPLLAQFGSIQPVEEASPKVARGQAPEIPLLEMPRKEPAPNAAGNLPKDDASSAERILLTCFAQDQNVTLDSVLQLANVENPTIGLADEIVRANLVERMLVRSMLFPTLNAGMSLDIHQGALISSRGVVEDVNRDSLYLGTGANVRAAETVGIPGIQLIVPLGDAFLAPRAIRQKVLRSQLDATATRHNILLDVSRTYLALVGAEASLLAYRQSEREVAEVAELTKNFADVGQGRESDAGRARSEKLLLEAEEQQASEEIVRWASELSRLLSSDPSIRLRPESGAPPLIHLVDPRLPLEHLIQSAEANRPEIAARSTDVALKQTRLQQERVRPFMPTLYLGVSNGNYGGGSNLVGYTFGHFNTRSDVDVMAVWTVQNLGMGNAALQNQARARIDQAQAQRAGVINQVRAEVAEAYTQTKASREQVEIAKKRVETAQAAYQQDLTRAKNQQGLVIEVLASLNLLRASRQDLVRALVGYSQSQFQLYVALGGLPTVSAQGEIISNVAPPAGDMVK